MNAALSLPNYYINDTSFDSIYPQRIQNLSAIHWTPLHIAEKAASFLAFQPGSRILDVGSGVGKFCLTGAHFHPLCEFHGVEQREELVDYALQAKDKFKLVNVHFLHKNFIDIKFGSFNGVYFFNSFGENLFEVGQIDSSIARSSSLYIYYSSYLAHILDFMDVGTRLVTYHGYNDEIPNSYELVDTYKDDLLKMWIKTRR